MHPMKRLTPEQPSSLTWQMWVSSFFIMGVWVYLSYFSVFSVSHTPSVLTNAAELLMVLVVGFLINSLFEELFYRVWLQTRLEGLLGTWPVACDHAHFNFVVNLSHQNSSYWIFAGRCRNGYRQSRGDWPIFKYVGSSHDTWDHQRASPFAFGVMEHVKHEYADGMVGILTEIYS
jgi:hypothetical protein